MTKTQNYQLNQWDAADRVRREDFNSDNQKIDEAIAALETKSSFVKLKELVTTQTLSTLKFDLTAIDWSAWRFVCAEIYLYNNNGGTANINTNLGGSQYSMGGSLSNFFADTYIFKVGTENLQPLQILFFPNCNPENHVRAFSFAEPFPCYSYTHAPFQKLEYFEIVTKATMFQPGCRMTVWGMR